MKNWLKVATEMVISDLMMLPRRIQDLLLSHFHPHEQDKDTRTSLQQNVAKVGKFGRLSKEPIFFVVH